MSSLFSSPTIPAPAIAPTPAPTQSSDAVQAAADSQRQRMAQASGRSATILSPPDTSTAAVPTKTLLGSAS